MSQEESSSSLSKLEAGLVQAMKAIDNQVARAMLRTPQERSQSGVRKWEPYESRVESIAAFILNSLGDDVVGMDSLFVLTQAFVKALRLVGEDLGEDGFGKVRLEYCIDTMERVETDAAKLLSLLRQSELT